MIFHKSICSYQRHLRNTRLCCCLFLKLRRYSDQLCCLSWQQIEAEKKWPPFTRRQFQMHFLKRKCTFFTTISLNFVLNGPINNILALVRIMAWRRPGDKPLSEPMVVSLLTHIYVTWHQWVNGSCHDLVVTLITISSQAKHCDINSLKPGDAYTYICVCVSEMDDYNMYWFMQCFVPYTAPSQKKSQSWSKMASRTSWDPLY